MKLKLEKPLLFFDIESTGLDIPVNSIVELSFIKLFPDGEERRPDRVVLDGRRAMGLYKQLPAPYGACGFGGERHHR